ncbi:unnamed protein product [Moneuplotes crassus]|uniref:Uncharacterized protein n=1 Tax=Euplotes crassus TaxID=5936 RepID=A0AAD1UEE4_EUPCR|nr:unnamed protein product [Moneuplotes crassus]
MNKTSIPLRELNHQTSLIEDNPQRKKQVKRHNTYMRNLKNRFKRVYSNIRFQPAARTKPRNHSVKRLPPSKIMDQRKTMTLEQTNDIPDLDKEITESETQLNAKISSEIVLEDDFTPNMFNVGPIKKNSNKKGRAKSSYRASNRLKHFTHDGNLKESIRVYSQMNENIQNERKIYSKSRADRVIKDYNLCNDQQITNFRNGSNKRKRPFTAKTRFTKIKRKSNLNDDIKSFKPVLKGKTKIYKSEYVATTYVPKARTHKRGSKRILQSTRRKHRSSHVLTDHLGLDASESTKLCPKKNLSPEKSYQRRREDIMQRLSKEAKSSIWPRQIEQLGTYKSFYWSPDFSYCGFSTQSNGNKAAHDLRKCRVREPSMANTLSFYSRLKPAITRKDIRNSTPNRAATGEQK